MFVHNVSVSAREMNAKYTQRSESLYVRRLKIKDMMLLRVPAMSSRGYAYLSRRVV